MLILTLNEAHNIEACLESVAWSDDVLVVDSFSTDGTVRLAEQYGARVLQRKFDNFANQRNYGLEHGDLRHEWVLHLDADERVTPPLQEALLAIASGNKLTTAFSAYRLPSQMIFRDRWLKYAGMYPTYQVRFGRLDALLFQQVGHGQRESLSQTSIGTLQEPLLHYSFSKGLEDWFARHNRYSSDEAREAFLHEGVAVGDWAGLWQRTDRTRQRRALKALSYQLPFRPLLRFVYMFVLKKGFLDGKPGLEYCFLLATYEYMIGAKMRELRHESTRKLGKRAKNSL